MNNAVLGRTKQNHCQETQRYQASNYWNKKELLETIMQQKFFSEHLLTLEMKKNSNSHKQTCLFRTANSTTEWISNL